MFQVQGAFDKVTRNLGNAYPTLNHRGTKGNLGEGPIRRTPTNRMGTEHTGFGRKYLKRRHACSSGWDGPRVLKDGPIRQGERSTGDLDHTGVLWHQGQQRLALRLFSHSYTGGTSKRRCRLEQVV